MKIGVLIINEKNQVLLIKEKIKKKPIPLWNTVKGSYDQNETIFNAAIRECKEEAGVEVKLQKTAGIYIAKNNDKLSIIVSFIAKITNGIPSIANRDEQHSRDEDIIEIKWFTKNELRKMAKDQFISNKIYSIIKSWLNDEQYPLDIIKQINM